MVNVYQFELEDGTVAGCGTKVEFEYWASQGLLDGHKLGCVIGQEAAACDVQRQAAWAKG
jgi:hypothetical protein